MKHKMKHKMKEANKSIFDDLIKHCESSMIHPFKKKPEAEPNEAELESEEPDIESEDDDREPSEESNMDNLTDEEKQELMALYSKMKG